MRAPDWWEAYWRGNPERDAWNGPITIRVTRQDDLESALERLKAAMISPRLKRGLGIYVHAGALRQAGCTLRSSITVDLNAKGKPAREVFDRVLEPMGLACKLQDGMVMVTSIESFGEPLFPGHHGEMFCDHGEWVRVRYKPSGP